jgi:hypothetical protein
VIGCGKWHLITLMLPPRRLVPVWCSLPLPRLFIMLTRRLFLELMGASGGRDDRVGPAVAGRGQRVAGRAGGSGGVEHVVVLMLENRSFDHFLSWLPGADGRHDMTYLAPDGNVYPNYPLAPDFQGCGYSDPDHSWEGFLIQHNFGKMDGFLQRPTAPPNLPGVTLAAANTFPIGYYTNLRHDGPGRPRKTVPDLPVIGALAENYTVLDRYFCSFAGETFPNRFYQHAARTDRDHNNNTISTMPSIWDQLSAPAGAQGRHPDQQSGDGRGQRRGRDLQRGQCSVGVTQAGKARSAPARRGPCAAAIRLAYRVRHGRVRQRAPQEPALMTAGSAGSSGHPAAGLRGGLVARK